MTAATAFLLSLVSLTIATQSQITTASGSDGVVAPSGSEEPGKMAMPRKADPNATVRTPSPGKPKQIPVAPDRTQAVEERLRSGQMEKAIAQGEISDRLDQLYGGSNSVTGETAAEHSSR